MSRIYFHGRNEEAVVRGLERHHFSNRIGDLFYATLDIPEWSEQASPFFQLIPKNEFIRRELESSAPKRYKEVLYLLECWLKHRTENSLIIGDRLINTFEAQLNTSYVIGSNPVKLMARLHGQCEIHCYVEGKNRQWLANIIDQGLKSAIFRKQMGWESVIDLLVSEQDSPIVTSYSVCRSFPNPIVANFPPSIDEDGDESFDQWYDIDPQVRWESSMQGLRNQSQRHLELTPDNWDSYYFGMGWDAFKINHLLTISPDQWSEIAKIYEESQLSATEAWEIATKDK